MIDTKPETERLVDVLHKGLHAREYKSQIVNWQSEDPQDTHPPSVYLEDYGLMLTPVLENVIRQDGGVRVVIVIYIGHDGFSDMFEYIHTFVAETENKAAAQGFDQWMQTDLPVLCDAVKEDGFSCTSMEMSKDDIRRKVIFGPVAHLHSGDYQAEEEEHAFCPCCLFTNSLKAFEELLFGSTETAAIRLLAARNNEGEFLADCRINGQDFEAGMAALREYAATWPAGAGFEMRKQYVFLKAV